MNLRGILSGWPRKQVFKGAVMPTPLQCTTAIPEGEGVEVYIKREDLIDTMACGNKVRKLEFLAADALHKKATVLVTAGSLPSNQCKAVAVTAHHIGLRSHLIYGGEGQYKPTIATPDYMLTVLHNPTVTWCDNLPWFLINQEIDRIVMQERNNGANPYIVRPGASEWPGLLGSVELGLELSEQVSAIGNVDFIICAAGSCGTTAGLEIVGHAMNENWKIIGACISGTADNCIKQHEKLCNEGIARLGVQKSDRVITTFVELDAEYDKPGLETLDEMFKVIKSTNLIFDHNYTIKPVRAFRLLRTMGCIKDGHRIVLVHTGGQLGLFGSSLPLQTWIQSKLGEYFVSTQV